MRVWGACVERGGRLDVFVIGKEFIRVVVELLKVDTVSGIKVDIMSYSFIVYVIHLFLLT